jgi:hypothetical protein
VTAHLAWASGDPPLAMVAGFLRARLDVNRLNDVNARRWARRGPPAILGQLGENARSGAKPFGCRGRRPWSTRWSTSSKCGARSAAARGG